MSCREFERLFIAGASEAQALEHARSCPACAAAARDHEEIGSLTSGLRFPQADASLTRALLSIPARTVSCEMADELAARAMEEEIDPGLRRRLDFHLARCGGCAQASQTLASLRDLTAPRPAPWLETRVLASMPSRSARRPRARTGWRWLLGPRAAIGVAYAAAVALMISGFNPADLARKARTDLPVEAKTVAARAETTLADRVGSLEERATRALVIVRSRVFGYGRAALSNAVTLVLKSEPAPARNRSRNGEEKGSLPKSETAYTDVAATTPTASQERT